MFSNYHSSSLTTTAMPHTTQHARSKADPSVDELHGEQKPAPNPSIKEFMNFFMKDYYPESKENIFADAPTFSTEPAMYKWIVSGFSVPSELWTLNPCNRPTLSMARTSLTAKVWFAHQLLTSPTETTRPIKPSILACTPQSSGRSTRATANTAGA